ncbi:MAG: hypothetical protein ABIL09_08530 [Gemmatimonadota bacterium]
MTALTALFVAMLVTAPAVAQDLHQTVVSQLPDSAFAEGRIDWANHTLSVYGEGVAPADVSDPVRRRLLGFRAAKVAAYRNLLEIVGQVQVDSRTSVSMAMVASDSVRQRVEGMVRGARVVPGSRQEADGLYRIAVELSLLGDFAGVLLPRGEGVAREDGEAEHGLPASLPPASDSLLVFTPPEPYTGVVVDARGSGLRPALAPRIVDETGRVIYSADHVDREYATEFGVAGYEREVRRAIASDRLGGASARPLIVSAAGASGLFSGDAVVSRDTGIRILMADTEARFLSECRVVFVVGPRPPAPGAALPGEAADSLLPSPDPDGSSGRGGRADLPTGDVSR